MDACFIVQNYGFWSDLYTRKLEIKADMLLQRL